MPKGGLYIKVRLYHERKEILVTCNPPWSIISVTYFTGEAEEVHRVSIVRDVRSLRARHHDCSNCLHEVRKG